jgi:Zn-dependent protease
MESLLARLPGIVIQVIAFALALSVHESAHGWVAERLGDPTARWLGRITLNPLKHIDPFGTIVFPLLLAVIGAPIIGWAKPVPFVARNLRNQRRDPALVGLAGPVSNVLFAALVTVALLVIKVLLPDFRPLLVAAVLGGPAAVKGVLAPLLALLFWIAAINLVLAVFNLVPVPPLDGSHVVSALLPPRLSWQYAQIGRYGMLILLALASTGFFGYLFMPVLRGLQWILLS